MRLKDIVEEDIGKKELTEDQLLENVDLDELSKKYGPIEPQRLSLILGMIKERDSVYRELANLSKVS